MIGNQELTASRGESAQTPGTQQHSSKCTTRVGRNRRFQLSHRAGFTLSNPLQKQTQQEGFQFRSIEAWHCKEEHLHRWKVQEKLEQKHDKLFVHSVGELGCPIYCQLRRECFKKLLENEIKKLTLCKSFGAHAADVFSEFPEKASIIKKKVCQFFTPK